MANCELCSNGMECMHSNYVDGLELCDSCFREYNSRKAEFLVSLLSKKQKKKLNAFLSELRNDLSDDEW